MNGIVTNNQWRQLVPGYEAMEDPDFPKTDFDWMGEEEIEFTDFIKYRGIYYALSEFERVPPNSPLSGGGWHGYHPHGFGFGVVIRLSDDGEEYQIGTYNF